MNPVLLIGLISAFVAALSTWAIVSRPDRWAGAADYFAALREIGGALLARRRAEPRALARLRFCSTACLACSSAMCALASFGLLLGWGWATEAYFAALSWHLCVTGAFALAQLLGPDLASEAGGHA
jgi:hypothetical protein